MSISTESKLPQQTEVKPNDAPKYSSAKIDAFEIHWNMLKVNDDSPYDKLSDFQNKIRNLHYTVKSVPKFLESTSSLGELANPNFNKEDFFRTSAKTGLDSLETLATEKKDIMELLEYLLYVKKIKIDV